jgi:hypothetical protein
VITIYAFSAFIAAMSWISLLAGGAEPRLLSKLALGLLFGVSGVVGLIYEAWRAL